MSSKPSRFFKRYDGYAKNVTLTYKKSGTYDTSCGGLASIVTFIMLFYWLLINCFYAIYDNGSFVYQKNTRLVQNADGSYPEYILEQYDLFIAFNYTSLSGLSKEEMDKYISFVYF